MWLGMMEWTMAMAASLSSTATAVTASSTCHHRLLILTRRFHHDHYLLSPIIAAHHNYSLSQYYYYSAGTKHHLNTKSSGSAIFLVRLASSSSQLPVNTMKLPPLAYPPFMVVAALSSVSFSSQARAFVTQPSYYLSCRTTPKIIPSTQNKRCVSSSSSSPAKELSVSAAAYDESTTTTTTPSNTDAMVVQGEILSYYSASSSSNTNNGLMGSSALVVVKICEEDLILPITKLSAAGLGAGVDGSVPMATTTSGTTVTTVQRSPVGLENSLFSKSGSSTAVTKDNTKSLKRIIGKFLCILFFSSFLHCHYFWNQIILPLCYRHEYPFVLTTYNRISFTSPKPMEIQPDER